MILYVDTKHSDRYLNFLQINIYYCWFSLQYILAKCILQSYQCPHSFKILFAHSTFLCIIKTVAKIVHCILLFLFGQMSGTHHNFCTLEFVIGMKSWVNNNLCNHSLQLWIDSTIEQFLLDGSHTKLQYYI